MENNGSESDSSISSDNEIYDGAAPYLFEPDASSSDEEGEVGAVVDDNRLLNLEWCRCNNCIVMPTATECRCCMEYSQYRNKCQNDSQNVNVPCITAHPGFAAVCLNVFVLETAYHVYRQQYGHLIGTVHERYRYTAYRQLVRWCYGYLGKEVRVVLPACAVRSVREEFSSNLYHGFAYPPLD